MHWLIKLYPRAWRERYGEEMAALLAARALTPGGVLDVLRGVLDAYQCPQAEERGMMTDSAYAAIYQAHPVLNTLYVAVEAGAMIALAAVLVGGLPVAFSALAGYLAFAVHGTSTHLARAIHQPLAPMHSLVLELLAVLGVGAVASAMAVALAVARSPVSPRLYRFALTPAAVAQVAMVVVLSTTTIWGLMLRASAPQVFSASSGALNVNRAVIWLAIILLMGGATLVAGAAVVRGFAARARLG